MQKKSVKTKAKKSLGQNFLVDKNILKKIVDINLINDETEIINLFRLLIENKICLISTSSKSDGFIFSDALFF